jgi:hypothetical protein
LVSGCSMASSAQAASKARQRNGTVRACMALRSRGSSHRRADR